MDVDTIRLLIGGADTAVLIPRTLPDGSDVVSYEVAVSNRARVFGREMANNRELVPVGPVEIVGKFRNEGRGDDAAAYECASWRILSWELMMMMMMPADVSPPWSWG